MMGLVKFYDGTRRNLLFPFKKIKGRARMEAGRSPLGHCQAKFLKFLFGSDSNFALRAEAGIFPASQNSAQGPGPWTHINREPRHFYKSL